MGYYLFDEYQLQILYELLFSNGHCFMSNIIALYLGFILTYFLLLSNVMLVVEVVVRAKN